MLALLLLLAQVAALAVAAYAGRARLKRLIAEAQNGAVPDPKDAAADDLHEVDKAILKLLAERQGVVYQSEIIKGAGPAQEHSPQIPPAAQRGGLRGDTEEGQVQLGGSEKSHFRGFSSLTWP
jgi:hypothetical protein